MADSPSLASCHCCGLVQQVPTVGKQYLPVCRRCATPLRHQHPGRNLWTSVLAASALAFYLPAMLLPLLRIERLGHAREDSLLGSIGALWAEGYWFVGGIVLLFSVIVPPLKLLALWLLSAGPRGRSPHRAIVYRLVEWLGRWGMLDVMLVAILVAFVKLGDLVSIHAGPGLLAFAVLVVCSLLASVTFNPLLMWEEEEDVHAD